MLTTTNNKISIAIVGGGAAALMLACELDTSKYDVTIYERNTALGRKFLVAGQGGFNLTHSESIDTFIERYRPSEFMEPSLRFFNNEGTRTWFSTIGIETYVGTSKRVFPVKGIKPIDVLKAIEKKLKDNTISILYEHEWVGFGDTHELLFSTKEGDHVIKPDITVFALGGASWKVTGSSGNWLRYFKEKGIAVNPFEASNCAFKVNWNDAVIKKLEGKALKNCLFSCGTLSKKGEAVLTAFGIEGSGVYPLSSEIRKQLHQNGVAKLVVDFKPDLSEHELLVRFNEHSSWSIKDVLLKKINLTEVHVSLIKQATAKEQYTNVGYLSTLIKAFPLSITGLAPIDDAISTIGGICLNEVNSHFELKQLPNHYCIGEMLDWDAPTGGYLLQGCFSMGHYLASVLNK